MTISLPAYRHLALDYFRHEFSDRPLEQLLLLCPSSFEEKMEKVIRLHHKTEKSPADAAAFMARLIRPRLKTLIVGLTDY